MRKVKPLNDFIFKKIFGEKGNEDTMRIYYERERSLHERANMISSAEERGIEKGIQKGIEKGIESGKLEIAKNLLGMKISIEQIILATGLTEEQIRRIIT